MTAYERRQIRDQLITLHVQEDLPSWITDALYADRLDLSKKNFEDDDDLATRGKAFLETRKLELWEKGHVARLEHKFTTFEIPQKHRPFILDPSRIEENQSTAAVRKFLVDPVAVFLLIMGLPSRGKSLAAAYGLCAYEDTHPWPRFLTSGQLLRLVHWKEADAERIASIEQAECVVLDELGQEPLDANGVGLSKIEDFITARYNSGRKTILTTNATALVLSDRYGGRVMERIEELGGDLLDVSQDRNYRVP